MVEKLVIAAKAPIPAYPALVLATLVNHVEPTSPLGFVVADEATVDGVTAVYKHHVGLTAVLQALMAEFAYLKVESKWTSLVLGPLQGRNFRDIAPELEKLDEYLNFRSFLDGYKPTATDAVVWGALRANGVVGAACKNGQYVNLTRWYSYLDANHLFGGSITQFTADVVEHRKIAKAQAPSKKESKASYEIDLVDAEDGKVVTRFLPEPSGYLHIGHAKAAILNQYFAKEYHGKLFVRMDDTNPSKEKVEFEDSILEDLELLGIKGDALSHTSDYFDKLHELAVKMISEGKAYCDDTLQEQMREERGAGIPSKRRDRTVDENLRVFDEMKKGSQEGLAHCLRAKISVDAKNKSLRDPVIYRCNVTPHHRTGTQWKIYPTYDFCCPVVDSLEGITHALRTIEYRDRNQQYEWMQLALGLRKVHIWDFSRVNFVRTLLSKRKLQWFVDTGRVSGWDDPRFPTVRGVRRRGMTIEGLRNWIISQGPSRNVINLDWSLIWNANKKIIDPNSPRYTAIQDPVAFYLKGGPSAPKTEERPRHKKNAELGNKPVLFYDKLLIERDDAETLSVGEKVTLMDWNNAIVDTIDRDANGAIVAVKASLYADDDFKSTKHKITWLADTSDVTPVELIAFDHLITKDKLEEDDKVDDFLTPQTIFSTNAVADLNVRDLKLGDILQFERKGYFRVDKPWSEGNAAVLFSVPDGKVISRYGAKKE